LQLSGLGDGTYPVSAFQRFRLTSPGGSYVYRAPTSPGLTLTIDTVAPYLSLSTLNLPVQPSGIPADQLLVDDVTQYRLDAADAAGVDFTSYWLDFGAG